MLTTLWIAVLVFTVPGLVVSWVSGLKIPWAIAASIPATFGIYGIAAWTLGVWEMRFDLRSVALATLVFVGVALVWRLFFAGGWLLRRRKARRKTQRNTQNEADVEVAEESEEPVPGEVSEDSQSVATEAPEKKSTFWHAVFGYLRNGGILDHRWWLPAAGAIAGAWLIIDRAWKLLESTPHGLNDIVQGWDVHWHGSMVRFIDETGIASSTMMGQLRNIETQQDMYYPSAWHAGAWVLSDTANLSIIEAVNITGIVLSGMLLPLAVALIAWRLVDNRGLTAQIGAGFAGLITFAAPTLFWVGNYVGAWPYVAAIGASGVVLALFMSTPAVPVRIFAAALAFAGMFQIHPAPATIVIIAVVLWWLLKELWVPSKKTQGWKAGISTRLKSVGILAFTGIVGVLLVLPQAISGSEETSEVLSYSAEEQVSRTESWLISILMETRHTDFFGGFNVWPILIAAAVGGAAVLLWRGNLWAPAFYAVSVALTVNSLKPFAEPWGDWLDIVGGLHYSTGHRLIMPVAMFTFAAAGIGLAVVIRLICLGPIKQFAAVSGVVSVVLAVVIAVPLHTWAQDMVREGSETTIVAPHDGRMVNDNDLAAWDWLIQQPRATELNIMGDPSDGHGWMYAYNGLHSIARHYNWPAAGGGSDTAMLYWWPHLLGAGTEEDPDAVNDVDQAARDLNVGYFMISPWPFWDFQTPNKQQIELMWDAPGVTPVYKKGESVIFAVNDMFTDAELDKMRKPGNSPEKLPELPTKGERGLAESADEWDETYYHRPEESQELVTKKIKSLWDAPDPSKPYTVPVLLEASS